jgi:hypothetical protein
MQPALDAPTGITVRRADRADRASRALSLVALVALVAAAACLAIAAWFLATSIGSRRWGPVEAEMVFEALRVRKGLPLYFDPAVGASEYGSPPTRYFVLYTPLWPHILAYLGPASLEGLRAGGRLVNSVAWVAFFGWLARTTPAGRRGPTLVACALTCGGFFLAREASLAGPDTIACVLAGIGMVRAARKGHMDALSAVLLATGPFIKPSAIGCALGVALAHLLVKRWAAWRSLGIMALVGGAWFAICWGLSHGMWPMHMFRATGQTLSLDRLGQELMARGLFLGLPHLVCIFFAFRGNANTVLRTTLVTTLAYSTLLLAKHGSGSHYFIEPSLACVTAVSMVSCVACPWQRLFRWTATAVLTCVTAAATMVGFLGERQGSRGRDDVLAALREACPLAPGQVAVSSDLTLELDLNGRVIIPVWQTTYLARRGIFSVDMWQKDLSNPSVRCVIHGPEIMDPVPEEITGAIEVSALRKELRPALDREFSYDKNVMGWIVFKRRDATTLRN